MDKLYCLNCGNYNVYNNCIAAMVLIIGRNKLFVFGIEYLFRVLIRSKGISVIWLLSLGV